MWVRVVGKNRATHITHSVSRKNRATHIRSRTPTRGYTHLHILTRGGATLVARLLPQKLADSLCGPCRTYVLRVREGEVREGEVREHAIEFLFGENDGTYNLER